MHSPWPNAPSDKTEQDISLNGQDSVKVLEINTTKKIFPLFLFNNKKNSQHTFKDAITAEFHLLLMFLFV